MSSQFYARYIPPKPHKSKQASFPSKAPKVPERAQEEPASKPARREKKKRKHNDESERQAELEVELGSEILAEAPGGDGNVAGAVKEKNDDDRNQKKKKRKHDKAAQAELEVSLGSTILAGVPGGDENVAGAVHQEPAKKRKKKRKLEEEEAQAEAGVDVGSEIFAETAGGDETKARVLKDQAVEKKIKNKRRLDGEAQAEVEGDVGSEILAEVLGGDGNGVRALNGELSKERKKKKRRKHAEQEAQAELEVDVGSEILAEAPSNDGNVGVAANGESTKKHKKKQEYKEEEERAEHEVDIGSEILAEAPGGDENVVGAVEEAVPTEVVEPPAKKQKRKKEKRRRSETEDAETGAENDAEAQEDDKENKKHKGVFAKFQKSSRRAENLKKAMEKQEPVVEQEGANEPELHGTFVQLSARYKMLTEQEDLVPLPQPDPVPDNVEMPTFSTLPTWLLKPVTVPSTQMIPFEGMGIHPKLVQRLSDKGYHDAFAIQAAVLPLLLPGQKHYFGDICVSAVTGSGKTLAYILPMVESMRTSSHYTRLRSIVVVPTRELVSQVREVAELCVSGTGLKVGTAVGSHTLAAEQEALVNKGQRYDPAKAKELEDRANKRVIRGEDEDDVLLDDAIAPEMLPFHVPEYSSKVDILICTPGRLVEHINSTQGFHLNDLEWLVIDEADRLLDESFQEWVDVVIGTLEAEKPPEKKSARDRIMDTFWEPREPRYVRKIILSATMTRDLQKLGGLKLRRPVLVSVARDTETREGEDAMAGAEDGSESFELPPALKEWAVPVEEAGNKPLILLRLLEDKISRAASAHRKSGPVDATDIDIEGEISSDSSDSYPDSDSDSDSGSDSLSADASSSNTSNNIFDNEPPNAEDNADLNISATPTYQNPLRAPSTVLVFTSANENATRLSHLLTHLAPHLASSISTLTKSSTSSAGRKVLSAFRSSINSHSLRNSDTTLRILIATDRAARGLDLPELGHVVNYDMPHSVTSYVHRVGRTARAGRQGQAWTLVEAREAWWFWNKVVRSGEARRTGEVERVRVEAVGKGQNEEELKERYELALGRLKEAVEREGKRVEKKESRKEGKKSK